MSIKEHAIMTAVVLTLMLAFIFAGEAADLPEVVDHDITMTEQEATWVCEEYVAQREKPCTVVNIDDRICYAYMELDGSSQPVQCFIKEIHK
jgi:hypothetical protein